jgi:hypothetical protein
MQFPIQVNDVPDLILTISVSALKKLLAALEAVGVATQELPNLIKKLVDDAGDACNGCLPGLIVSNREDKDTVARLQAPSLSAGAGNLLLLLQNPPCL